MGYLENFTNQATTIKDRLNSISTLLENKKQIPQLKETIEKFEQIKEYATAKLETAIPAIVNNNSLTIIINNLQNLETFIQQQNIAEIDNRLSAVIIQINSVPLLNKKTTQGALNQIILQFKNQINETKKQDEERHKTNNELLTKINQQIVNLNTNFTQKSNEVTNLTANFQQQFTDAQEKRLNEAKEYLDKIGAIQKQRENGINAETENLLQEMKRHVENSKKLHGIVSGNSNAGNYLKYANNAENRADKLFNFSIILMLFFAFIIILPTLLQTIKFIFSAQTPTQPDMFMTILKELLYRIPVFSIILIPAFYSAIESNKQREKAFKYRDFEMKITSSTPYIDDIGNETPTTEKNKLKIELAKVFFGKTYEENDSDNVVIPKDALKLLDTFLDKFIKITKNK